MKGTDVHLKRNYARGKEKALALGQLQQNQEDNEQQEDQDQQPILSSLLLPCPSPPYPINPPGGRKGEGEWEWLWKEVGADVIAEQMTLLESEIYCRITPRECIAHLRSKNKEKVCFRVIVVLYCVLCAVCCVLCVVYRLFCLVCSALRVSDAIHVKDANKLLTNTRRTVQF